MKELKEKLVESLKGYTFEEMLELLNKNNDPEVRDTIMIAMEKYENKKYMKWMEE